ncbi:MAG TPA: response regulator transcription factor [Micropepsaceae bacterium]|nr:response regulator transcription factor [Micropepsaceae bacterium]
MAKGHAQSERLIVQSGTLCSPDFRGTVFDASSAARPKLFIVSDIRLLCDGLTLALSQQSAVNVLGFADLSIAPVRLAEAGPDVLLLDIGSSGALAVCRRIHQSLPAVRIVAIAVAEVEQDVIACAEAGICGFVTRQGTAQDVVAAVQSAARGESVCSPRVTAFLLNGIAALSSKGSAMPDVPTLTGRESEIASLVSEGLSNKEIARTLRIRNATVKNHVHSILGKLHVRRRGEAAAQLRKIRFHPQASSASTR